MAPPTRTHSWSGLAGAAVEEHPVRTVVIAWAFGLIALPALAGQQPTLDYTYFRDKVEPIFLKKRPGHARCVSCHGQGTPLRLQPLDPGATTWTEEESQKNFAVIRRVASAGMKSRLLLHPLEEKAGGDFYHSGGKHWTSKDDPEWKALEAFVMGETR
jgi:hypothetical protein